QPGLGHLIKQPAGLGSREISIEDQSSSLLEHRGQSLMAERVAIRCSAAALPDNRVMYGLPGLAVPYDRGFPLVRNPDCGNLVGFHPGFREHAPGRPKLRRPDLVRIMLNPSRPWIKLFELLLRNCDGLTGLVE